MDIPLVYDNKGERKFSFNTSRGCLYGAKINLTITNQFQSDVRFKLIYIGTYTPIHMYITTDKLNYFKIEYFSSSKDIAKRV